MPVRIVRTVRIGPTERIVEAIYVGVTVGIVGTIHISPAVRIVWAVHVGPSARIARATHVVRATIACVHRADTLMLTVTPKKPLHGHAPSVDLVVVLVVGICLNSKLAAYTRRETKSNILLSNVSARSPLRNRLVTIAEFGYLTSCLPACRGPGCEADF